MRYNTKDIYDIDPKKLAKMSYKEALEACKAGAIKKRDKLVNEQESIYEWNAEKEEEIKYLSKSIEFFSDKVKEME